MKETDDIDINITIAGQPLELTVPFNTQEHVRAVEAHIATLYNKWHALYPRKSHQELLAMLAYQYASYYFSMREREDISRDKVRRLLDSTDKLLASIGRCKDAAI